MTELETNAQRDRRVMADMPFPHSAPANPLLPPERVAEFCREGYVSCQPPPSLSPSLPLSCSVPTASIVSRLRDVGVSLYLCQPPRR